METLELNIIYNVEDVPIESLDKGTIIKVDALDPETLDDKDFIDDILLIVEKNCYWNISNFSHQPIIAVSIRDGEVYCEGCDIKEFKILSFPQYKSFTDKEKY